MSAARETIEVDAELLYVLLDAVSSPPERQGRAAHAGVPWFLVLEARAHLDEHGIGPGRSFDWRLARLIGARNKARHDVGKATTPERATGAARALARIERRIAARQAELRGGA